MPGEPRPAALPSVPVAPAALTPGPVLKGEPYGDILGVLFDACARFFRDFEPEETDESFLRDVVTAARATVKRVEAGAVAVSSPAVLRKLKGNAKALKRALEDVTEDEVADDEVDANPDGVGDASVAKKKKARRR